MKQTNHRLKPSKNHCFTGHQIVRDRRLRFTLNGREFKAYAGDTILTALLANGIFSAGHANGGAVALDAALQLCVKLVDAPNDVNSALPIDRTLAQQGMTLEIFGAPHTRLKAPFGGAQETSLKIDFDKFPCVPGPLHNAPVSVREKINLLVVGGGIAGMTAAVDAAEAGKNVILLERRGYLGGDAELFGHADGEEDPREVVAALRQKIGALPNIAVFLFTEALSVKDRKLMAHRVDSVDGKPKASLMRIAARNIILATGAADKIPLFPGNRLPHISPLTEVFHLATAYGIWHDGQSALFTNTNIAYRFAGQAQNADATFIGVYDARTDRASRFIDIAKAGGQKIINGARVHSVSSSKHRDQLYIKLEPSHSGFPALGAVNASQLVVNDGWQPRLGLWQQAGGKINIDGTFNEDVMPENIILAGSCAGYKGHIGVQQSALAAVGRLFLKKNFDVSDPQIDPQFETPEGPQTLSSALKENDLEPCYTSWGGSLVTLDTSTRKGFLAKLFSRDNEADKSPITDRALNLVDTLILAQQDILPSSELEHLLKERAITPLVFEAGETRFRRKFLAENLAAEVPDYIKGRFGKDASVWTCSVENGNPLQTGILLFPNTDVSDPLQAIGIVVGEGKTALINAGFAVSGAVLVARVNAMTSTIKLREEQQRN